MKNDSILSRVSDQKKFKVTFLAHWSHISSEDGSEDDTVKWYGIDSDGNEMLVGAVSGHSYLCPSGNG